MKRSFPPPAREALCALVGVLVCGAACEPNQDVPPGAPVLKEFTIFSGGTTPTTVTADTPDCAAGIVGGESCNPAGTPPDGLCRQASAMNWCNCVFVPDPMDATNMLSIWDCSPFTNVSAVIAVFDRLLYTAPLDPGHASRVTDVSAPQPEFPSGTTITVSLQANKVLAKDGTTPFTGNGLLQGGTLVFTMAPFSAVVLPADAMNPAATVAFTNFADPSGHVTATVNGAPVEIVVEAIDGGATFSVTPMAGPWPVGATVVVTVDAATTNLLMQPIAAAASVTFTAVAVAAQ